MPEWIEYEHAEGKLRQMIVEEIEARLGYHEIPWNLVPTKDLENILERLKELCP